MCKWFYVTFLGCNHTFKERRERCPLSYVPPFERRRYPRCHTRADLRKYGFPIVAERTRTEVGICTECAVGLDQDLKRIFQIGNDGEIERRLKEW